MGKYDRAAKLYWSLVWFVFGYFLEDIGCCLLIYKINKQRSIYGISIDSQICLLVATLSRVCFFTDTQLPTITVAMVELVCAVALHFYIVFKCLTLKDKDLHKESPWWSKWYVILVVSALLAYAKHPGKNSAFGMTQQFFVSFTMFTEALSLLP